MLLNRLYWSAYLSYHLRGQSRFSFLPISKIKTLQNQQLQKILHHAYQHVPYYRETMKKLGLQPRDFQTVEDLKKLPILERWPVQTNLPQFTSTAGSTENYLELRSSGTTGTPLSIYHDSTSLLLNAAHGERDRVILAEQIGKTWGYKETVISSLTTAAVKVREFINKTAFFPKGLRIERQYLIPDASPKNVVDGINAFQPDVIHSYGSYLQILFPFIHTSGMQFHRPKAITYSSDGLATSVRELITNTFGIPVFSTYQAIEAFKIGFECPQHSGLHLNMDLYPVRIVDSDGVDLPFGEDGEVVISNLVNRATILLNYRLGDIAAILKEPCKCGRSLPLLSYPKGRVDDCVQLPSGDIIHSFFIRSILGKEREIWQWQVVQSKLLCFEILIVLSPMGNREEIKERVVTKFRKTLGPEPEIRISFVDTIASQPGGKIKPIISLHQLRSPS